MVILLIVDRDMMRIPHWKGYLVELVKEVLLSQFDSQTHPYHVLASCSQSTTFHVFLNKAGLSEMLKCVRGHYGKR